MSRVIPPLGQNEDKSLPKWLDPSEIVSAGKDEMTPQEGIKKQANTSSSQVVLTYQCLACRKSYPVENAAIKTQISAAKLAGKGASFTPICPNCTSPLTAGKTLTRPHIENDIRTGDLTEKRSSLNKEASGTYNTYLDQHVIYKALNSLQRHCIKSGMINPEIKYIHSEHQTMAGQEYPSLNNITCKIEWLYGRKQKARVYAGVSIDQAGKVILPQTFITADKVEHPFTKESIKELEKYAESPKMMKQELKATDIPVFKRPDISRFKAVNSSLEDNEQKKSLSKPVFGRDKTGLKKEAYDSMLTSQPSTPAVPSNNIVNPMDPYTPGAQLSNTQNGQIYTVKEQQPGVGIVATDAAGQEVVIPEGDMGSIKPVVKTTTLKSLAEELVERHLQTDIEGDLEHADKLNELAVEEFEEAADDMELLQQLTSKKVAQEMKTYIVCERTNLRGPWSTEFHKVQAISAIDAIKKVEDWDEVSDAEMAEIGSSFEQYLEKKGEDEASWSMDPGDHILAAALSKGRALILVKEIEDDENYDDDDDDSDDADDDLESESSKKKSYNTFGPSGQEDLFTPLLQNTYQDNEDDRYEVYFADSYIELIQNDKVVEQYDYPGDMETAPVHGEEVEPGEDISNGVYLNTMDGYLEFIQNNKVLFTLNLDNMHKAGEENTEEENIEDDDEIVEDSLKEDFKMDRPSDARSSLKRDALNKVIANENIPDTESQVKGNIKPHVPHMSRRWKEIREDLRQKQAARMQEDINNTPVEKLSREQIALRESLGYTPTKVNTPNDAGRDPVTGLPVGETGQRDFQASPDFDSKYDRPFGDAEKEFEVNQPKFKRDHEKARDMNRREQKELHKNQDPDPMTVTPEVGKSDQTFSTKAMLEGMLGIIKEGGDESEPVEKPIEYKPLKKAPKVDEFEEPAVIPMSSEKVKEAITKFKKVQGEIADVKKKLQDTIAPLQEQIKEKSAPINEDLKTKGDLLTSYLKMLYDQIRKTDESVVAYEDFVIAAVSRDVQEKGSTVTVAQLIAHLETLLPDIAEKVKEVKKVIEDERTTNVIQRIIYEYPQSTVQKKKIESSTEGLGDLIKELSHLINSFTEINSQLVLPS